MRIVFLAGFICLFFTAKSQYLIGIDAGPDFGKSSTQNATPDLALSFIYNPKYFCARAGFGVNRTSEFGKISRQFIYVGVSTNAKVEDFIIARFMIGYAFITPLDRRVTVNGEKELKSNYTSFSFNTSLGYRVPKINSIFGINISYYTMSINLLKGQHSNYYYIQRKIPFSLSYNYEF